MAWPTSSTAPVADMRSPAMCDRVIDRMTARVIDRHPYPVRRARERAARVADRLMLVMAAVVVVAMLGGVL